MQLKKDHSLKINFHTKRPRQHTNVFGVGINMEAKAMKKILLCLIVTLVLFSLSMAGAEEYIHDSIIGGPGTDPGQFNQPKGIAVDQAGNVYVADTGNNRVQRLFSDGNPMGFLPSSFSAPKGVAVDQFGNVYVADTGNNCIKKFDSYGNYSTQWGSYGSGQGQFDSPSGVSISIMDGGTVYVADTNNGRIQVFGLSGNFVRSWNCNSPRDVAVDVYGNVFVTGPDRVTKFDPTGFEMIYWPMNTPQGIATDTFAVPRVYVAESIIHKFDDFGGPLALIGSPGTGPGQLLNPEGVAVDPALKVFVADTGNNRLQTFVPVITTTTITTTTTTTTTTTLPPTAPELIQLLILKTQGMNLQAGFENSLDVKLSHALEALEAAKKNSFIVAINALESFINECQAQSGKALTVEQAQELINDANYIITLLH